VLAEGTAVESVCVLLFIWPTRSLDVAELLGAELWLLAPVEFVVPTWFWSDGLVVVVVVVWLPSGLLWLWDVVVDGLLGAVPDWSCVLLVCAAATPKASSSVAAVIPNVRMFCVPPTSLVFADSQSGAL
jgi:hypothetical protein